MDELYKSKSIKINLRCDPNTKHIAYIKSLDVEGKNIYLGPKFFKDGIKRTDIQKLKTLLHELSHFNSSVVDKGGYGAVNVSSQGIAITQFNADAHAYYILMANGHKIFQTEKEMEDNELTPDKPGEEEGLDLINPEPEKK